MIKNLALLPVALILFPLFLVFFCPIAFGYLFFHKGSNCFVGSLLLFLGVILGFIVMPCFIVIVFFYILIQLGKKCGSLCCSDGACGSIFGYHDYPNQIKNKS